MRYRLTLYSAAAVALGAFSVVISADASAQTLTNPNPPAPSRPPPAANPDRSSQVRSCSAYGAGYVNVPGTDACVKFGGSVTVGGSVNQGR
jgi:hypothetical protein